MTIIPVNNSSVEVSREKATKFINASDNTVNRLARKNYNKLNRESDKKFDKRVSTTLNTLPLVAVASGLAMKKGIKGSLLSGLGWGLAIAAPSVVGAANKALVKASPDVAKAEKKHPLAALTANIAASFGAYFGMAKLADKLMANPKVNKLGSEVATRTSEAMTAAKEKLAPLAEKVKLPESAKAKLEKVKIPEFMKNSMKTIAKSPVTKGATRVAKDLGKFVGNNAPTLLVAGIVGAIIDKGISDARKMNAIKGEIKDAQFNTARNLVKELSAENAELKAENARLANADTVTEEVE